MARVLALTASTEPLSQEQPARVAMPPGTGRRSLQVGGFSSAVWHPVGHAG